MIFRRYCSPFVVCITVSEVKRFVLNKTKLLVVAGILCVFAAVNAQNAFAQNRQDANGAQQNRARRQFNQNNRPAFERPNLKPTLFANLGDKLYTPDGMAIHSTTGALYLNVPNFGRMNENESKTKPDSAQGGYLYEVQKDGSVTKILEYPVLEETGQAGPMGIACGPDGNLYVCDNQYFHNTNSLSRILRVVCQDGKPTGEVQVVIEGLKLANGIVWYGDKMFYTDSFFDIDVDKEEGIIGSGGVFLFTLDEVKAAGTDGKPALKVNASPDDPHCVAYQKVTKLGRGDNTGPDGLCVDKNGVLWFGNFGNGFIYCLRPNEAGEYKQENVENVFDALNQPGVRRGQYQGSKLECCDGICYDPNLDVVFIDDSCGNAIWYFKPCAKGEKITPRILWKNDDNDGNEGLLDQPCEAIVFDGKLVIVNFDWPFPGLANSKLDPPGTLSAIDYAEIEKFVRRAESFQQRGGAAPNAPNRNRARRPQN